MRNEKKLFEDWLDTAEVDDEKLDVSDLEKPEDSTAVYVIEDKLPEPAASKFEYLIRIDISGHNEVLFQNMSEKEFDDYIV